MKLIDLEFNLRKHELKRNLTLSKGVYIENLSLTVESLLNVLKKQSGNKAYLPYYWHLFDIYKKLEHELQNR